MMNAYSSQRDREWKGWIFVKSHACFLPFFWVFILFLLCPGSSCPAADVVIQEFMAANSGTLPDEDGDYPDWIEIANEGAVSQSLLNWCLTDSRSNPTKWRFPDVSLDPGEYLVIFASDKNRRVSGKNLHTNFKLSADGEYLALLEPDGKTIATEFAPSFPPQVSDVSFGFGRTLTTQTLIGDSDPAKALVPSNADLALTWTDPTFEDSAWALGTSGVGYERDSGYEPLIGLDTESMMFGKNQTIYIRFPFNVTDPSLVQSLLLRMKYDDGFIVYLNGEPVAERNAPEEPGWSSGAVTYHDDPLALVYEDIDISAHKSALHSGTNVLAFHGLNWGVNSSDFLILPLLEAGIAVSASQEALGYFLSPTPGESNNISSTTLGPLILEATHTPSQPLDNEPLQVTARVMKSLETVASVMLHYRIMFGTEGTATMLDDGLHGDGASGDGVFGAAIPAALSLPGQMVRYYITAKDVMDSESRLPLFLDPTVSPQYFGTVIADSALQTPLPVFHWFVQDTAGADNPNQTGARASVYYNGIFYDNIFVRVRGATAAQVPKKPYKFDFNRGYHFNLMDGRELVEELNLNSTFQDKAYIRPVLTFETYRASGVPACQAFPVRVQRNDQFFSLALAIEQVDDDFLEAWDLDPEGALYKIFNGLTGVSVGTYEKKTRKDEGITDLQQFVNSIQTANSNRNNYLMDNLNVPCVINYLASGIISQDWDRAIKNYYLYRDTNGTGEWSIFPWDKDLTFGASGLQSDYITGSDDSGPAISHPFYGDATHNCCGVNRLFDAIYAHPALREMFVRRLRTLMDHFLQPPGTANRDLLFEKRLDDLYPLLQADAALDLAKWGPGFGQSQTLSAAFSILKTNYFQQRRVHLYQTHFSGSPQDILTTGRFSEAAKYGNGGLRKIELPYLSQFNSSVFSAEFWVKISFSTSFQVLLSRAPKGSGHWEIYTTPSSGFISLYTPDLSPHTSSSSLTINDSQWHFISFRISSGKLLLFVDGTKVIDQAVTGTIASNNYPVIVGALPDQEAPNNFPITGSIDDLRISNTSRAMNSVPSGPLTSDSSTLGLFHFDALEDNSFPDDSPKNNPAIPFRTSGEIPDTQPNNSTILIDSIHIAPVTHTQSGDYIRLVNPNDFAADVSGWRISGPIEFEFQPGTVIPGTEPHNVLYLSPDVNGFRKRTTSPTGGQGLFVQGNYSGSLTNTGYPVTLENAIGTIICTYEGEPILSPQQQWLRISELMFDPSNPPDGSVYTPGDFEFIELQNTGSENLDLEGITFSDGVSFVFSRGSITSLAPGGYALIVSNHSAFESRYGVGLPIAGEYEGGLDKNGEHVALIDSRGGSIVEFDYSDGRGWPGEACGAGHSLVPLAEAYVNEPSGSLYYGGNWRGSTFLGGSPGAEDPEPIPGLIISEASASAKHPWAELHNPTQTPISFQYLFLSTSADELNKWALPPTTLQPGAHWIVDATSLAGFNLDPTGGKLFLTHMPPTDQDRVVDCMRYKALESIKSTGRYPVSEPFLTLMAPTKGGDNQPGSTPLIISEVMYHPQQTGPVNLEYIEIHNSTDSTVSCGNSAGPWRFSGGIDFTFPNGFEIPARSSVLVAGFEPLVESNRATFEQAYNLPTGSITLLGPYEGHLSGKGERITIEAPVLTGDKMNLPAWAVIDEVIYFHAAPWPEEADGQGKSLHRLSSHISGNNPTNWIADSPSPGGSTLKVNNWHHY